jgi:hypothetical protein
MAQLAFIRANKGGLLNGLFRITAILKKQDPGYQDNEYGCLFHAITNICLKNYSKVVDGY